LFILPFAFHESGLLLGTFVTVITAFVLYICMLWLIDTMARAEGYKHFSLMNFSALSSILFDQKNLLLIFHFRVATVNELAPGTLPDHMLTYRKFDYSAIWDLFMGSKGKTFCLVVLCIYC